MSCPTCNCNPCSCECSCDPDNEALESAFQNFVNLFIGTVTKTCSNGQVVWTPPCDLDGAEPVTGFPKLSGESVSCYFLRVLQSLATGGGGVQALLKANNLSDVDDAAAALANIGGQAACNYLSQICALTLVAGDILYVSDTGEITNLPRGADGEVLQISGILPSWAAFSTGSPSAFLTHETAAGVGAGGLSSGSWVTRPITTVEFDPDSIVIALAANAITLDPGTYRFSWKSTLRKVDNSMSRLFNVTTAAAVANGSLHNVDPATSGDSTSYGAALVTIAAQTQFRLEVQVSTTNATDGFGYAPPFGSPAIHAGILIIKEA